MVEYDCKWLEIAVNGWALLGMALTAIIGCTWLERLYEAVPECSKVFLINIYEY